MKTPVARGSFAVSRHARVGIAFALGCTILPSDFARADTWIGNPAEELPFGDGANWSLGTVPIAIPATINNGGAARILSTDVVAVSRLEVGISTQGNRVIQEGGDVSVSGPLMVGFGAGASGSYTATGGGIFTGGIGATDNTSIGRGGGTGTMSLTNVIMAVSSGEFFVGQGAGSQGTLTLTDSELSANSWIAIGRGGGTGSATLNGESKLYTSGGGFVVGAPVGGVSTGTLTINDKSEAYYGGGNPVYVGEAANGTVNVNDEGKFYSSASAIWVGTAGGSNGRVNVGGTGQFYSSTGGIWVGNGAGANGRLDMTDNATASAGNEVYIGNEGGTGVVNLSGDSRFSTASHKFVISRWNGTGTVNVDGNAVISIGASEIVVAENATGTLNIRGNGQVIAEAAAMNIYIGGGQFTDVGRIAPNGTVTMDGGTLWAKTGDVVLALPAVGTGLLQLNGGVVQANAVRKGAGAGTINFNGGTVRANTANADYFTGFTGSGLVLQAGGMRFDTNGNAVTVTQGLGGTGGIAKLGAGTLTLTGVHSFSGAVSVEEGMLAIAAGGALSDAAWISVANGADLSLASAVSLDSEIVLFLVNGADVILDFDGAATIAALWINGAAVAPDEYTLAELNDLAGTVVFSGDVDAMLDVTSTVPEPGTFVLLLAAGATVAMRRFRRKA